MNDRKFYYCDNTRHHKHQETIQILTQEENPYCPYCGVIMTRGRWEERNLLKKGRDPIIMTKSKGAFTK